MKNGTRRFLGIETSQEWLGLCLWEGGLPGRINERARFFKKALNKHSDWIIPKIDSLLNQLSWTPGSLDAIAVDIGPGSFTGVRIGLTVARTLGQSLDVPLIGIPSLDITAAGFGGLVEDDVLASLSRAVPGSVYLGLYRARPSRSGLAPFKISRGGSKGFQHWPWFPAQNGLVLERLAPLGWMSDAEALGRMKRLERSGQSLTKIETELPRPEILAGLAHWAWAHGGQQNYPHVIPLYLQPSWAERRFV